MASFFKKKKDPAAKLAKKVPAETVRLLGQAKVKELAAVFCQLAELEKGRKSREPLYVTRDTFSAAFFPEFVNLSNAFFSAFDVSGSGRLEWHDFVLGLALCSQLSSKEEKISFVFRMFDADHDQLVSKDDLRRMLTSSFFRAATIKRVFCDALASPDAAVNLPRKSEVDQRVAAMVDNAFHHYAVSHIDGMTYDEFFQWSRDSWDIDQLLRKLVDTQPAVERRQHNLQAVRALVAEYPRVGQYFREFGISPAVLMSDLDMLRHVTKLLGTGFWGRHVVEQPSDPAGFPPGTICTVEAQYPYAAQSANDMTIAAGDRMFVTFQDKSGWWLAVKRDGQTGYVPANYLLVLATNPTIPPAQHPEITATPPRNTTTPLRIHSASLPRPAPHSTPADLPSASVTRPISPPTVIRPISPTPTVQPITRPISPTPLVQPVIRPISPPTVTRPISPPTATRPISPPTVQPAPLPKPIARPVSPPPDVQQAPLPKPIATPRPQQQTSDAASSSQPLSDAPPVAPALPPAPPLRPIQPRPAPAPAAERPPAAPASSPAVLDVVDILRNDPRLKRLFEVTHDSPLRQSGEHHDDDDW